jgi:hypothetical protein
MGGIQMTNLELFGPENPPRSNWRKNKKQLEAFARRSDPQTSHAAAKSVSLTNLGKTKNLILAILRECGPMRDEQIIVEFRKREGSGKIASDAGIRSRRAWLVDHGFVTSWSMGKTSSGRACQIWRAR